MAVTTFGVIVLGSMYSVYLGDEIRYPDEAEYLSIAESLVGSGIYSLDGDMPTAYRPPAYPMFLSLLLRSTSNIKLIRIANFVIFALALCVLNILLARKFGKTAASIATILTASYPVFWYAAGTFYPQVFASGLFLLVLFLFFSLKNRVSIGRLFIAGFVAATLVLAVPTFIFSIGLISIYYLYIYRRKAIIPLALFSVVFASSIGAWQIRNYQQFDGFIFVSTNSGINLLYGNSEDTRPDSGVNVNISKYTDYGSSLGELEQDRFYRDAAIDWIGENPKRALVLYGQKVVHYFSYKDQLATASEASSLKNIIMLVTYGPLLALLILRLVLIGKYPLRSIESLLLSLFILNAFFMAIFFTRIRFRLPFDFMLISANAVFLAEVLMAKVSNKSASDAGIANPK